MSFKRTFYGAVAVAVAVAVAGAVAGAMLFGSAAMGAGAVAVARDTWKVDISGVSEVWRPTATLVEFNKVAKTRLILGSCPARTERCVKVRMGTLSGGINGLHSWTRTGSKTFHTITLRTSAEQKNPTGAAGVLLHELGHMTGLAHNTKPCLTVMSPVNRCSGGKVRPLTFGTAEKAHLAGW